MKTIVKTLKYYELLMTYNDTSVAKEYQLPANYHYEFYKPGAEKDWISIHISSGEFTSKKTALKYFHQYYNSFYSELNKRCIFIVNNQGEKIATATVSPLSEEVPYTATVDWLAIKKEYQGKGLAKPLISRTIKLANELGNKNLFLHTQTHTWLAAKLYLDLGFVPYEVTKDNIIGWQILKTLTNHPTLKELTALKETEIYDSEALLILTKLERLHKDFT